MLKYTAAHQEKKSGSWFYSNFYYYLQHKTTKMVTTLVICKERKYFCLLCSNKGILNLPWLSDMHWWSISWWHYKHIFISPRLIQQCILTANTVFKKVILLFVTTLESWHMATQLTQTTINYLFVISPMYAQRQKTTRLWNWDTKVQEHTNL